MSAPYRLPIIDVTALNAHNNGYMAMARYNIRTSRVSENTLPDMNEAFFVKPEAAGGRSLGPRRAPLRRAERIASGPARVADRAAGDWASWARRPFPRHNGRRVSHAALITFLSRTGRRMPRCLQLERFCCKTRLTAAFRCRLLL